MYIYISTINVHYLFAGIMEDLEDIRREKAMMKRRKKL